jgi:hypothetical protein
MTEKSLAFILGPIALGLGFTLGMTHSSPEIGPNKVIYIIPEEQGTERVIGYNVWPKDYSGAYWKWAYSLEDAIRFAKEHPEATEILVTEPRKHLWVPIKELKIEQTIPVETKLRSSPQTISETLEILDKAIKDESEAISFYMDAYERTSEPIEVARLFRELALEEQKHRERLAEAKRLVKL